MVNGSDKCKDVLLQVWLMSYSLKGEMPKVHSYLGIGSAGKYFGNIVMFNWIVDIL